MQKYILLLKLLFYFLTPHHLLASENNFTPLTLYSQTSGNWNSPSLWNTQRNGSGASHTDPNNSIGPTGPEYHIIIQSGHTVVLNDTKGISTIIVETGAKIFRNTTSNRYLEIYGNLVQVDGTMGNGTIYDGMGLELQTAHCAITGGGSIHLSRLRKQAFIDTNADILTDVTLNYAGGALYNDIDGYAFNVNIPAGVRVTITNGDLSIDGVDGTNNSARWGTFIINGILDIGRNLYVRTDNPIQGSQDISYIIGNGGQVIVRGKVFGNELVGGHATAHLMLGNSAILQVLGPGEVFQDIDGNRDNFFLQSGSIVDYAGANLQLMEDELLYAQLAVNGGSEKILEGNVLIQENLLLNAGYPVLDNHNLIINEGGIITGGSSASYAKTTANGKLIQSLGAIPLLFPIGVNNYAPIQLQNTGTPDIFALRAAEEVLTEGYTGTPFSTNVVNCTWYIEELAPGGSWLDIMVQWETASELPLFDRSNCYISSFRGEWDTAPSHAAQGHYYFQLSRSGISQPSPITVASGGQLPVELSYFIANEQNKNVILQWQTISEVDNEWFVIERTSGGAPFQELSRVPGVGTSRYTNNYQYLDTKPNPGINYYRLRQIDFDGQESFSPIHAVEIETIINSIDIWPNPVANELNLGELPENILEILIIDATGRLIQRFEVSEDLHQLNLSYLETGIYALIIHTSEGFITQTFSKL